MRQVSPILRWSIASVVAGCLAAGASRGASAQDQSSTASPPRTAGEVALLGNKMDAAAVKGVFEAISAADPLVRTVAARVAGVSGHPAFAVPIASALEREQHATAAGEQVRALLLIRGAGAVEAIEMRVANLDPGVR